MQFELQSKLEMGTVLSKMYHGIENESNPDDCPFREWFELTDSCLQVLSEVSKERLRMVSKKILNELGPFLGNVGIRDGRRSKETFEMLLQCGEKMISLFRRQCGSIQSVTHNIGCLDRRLVDTIHYVRGENEGHVIECRVKRLNSRTTV